MLLVFLYSSKHGLSYYFDIIWKAVFIWFYNTFCTKMINHLTTIIHHLRSLGVVVNWTCPSFTRCWFTPTCGQPAQGIDIKLDVYIYYDTFQGWLTFGLTPFNYRCFLASDYWISVWAFANTAERMDGLRFSGPTKHWSLQVQSTFDHAGLKTQLWFSHHFDSDLTQHGSRRMMPHSNHPQ